MQAFRAPINFGAMKKSQRLSPRFIVLFAAHKRVTVIHSRIKRFFDCPCA